MKKKLPLLIVASLLIGSLITFGTSREDSAEGGKAVKDCGFSVSSQTDKRTTLRECLLNTYGWPYKYATSGVEAILRDYHTIVPGDPSNASSIIGYTSFSRMKFIEDWVLWSIASGVVIVGAGTLLTKSKPTKKPTTKKKK